MRLCVYCFCLVFFFCDLHAGGGRSFSKKDVHDSIEEMLKYHVEYKTFSPLLARRSVKLFLEQFDPHRMYLLQEEVDPFWRLQEKELLQMVASHKRGEYPVYEHMYRQVKASIMRARSLREKVRKEVLEELTSDIQPVSLGGFASQEQVLRAKVREQMLALLEAERREEGIEQLSKEEIKVILQLFESRMCQAESRYLALPYEHTLSMLILKAFAKSLDAHSSFFTPDEARELKTNLERQFEGVGIVLKEGMRGVVIRDLVPGGPAERSGKISVGDVLLSVEGKQVDALSYDEVMSLLKGEKGRSVRLSLQKRDGKVLSCTLVREKVAMEGAFLRYDSVPCGDGVVGIVELPSFYESSDGRTSEKDLKEALRKLKQQGPLQGVVLDMRNNAGGFLTQAVKVASLFVSSGVIVISKYAEGQMQYLRDVDGRVFYEGPLVVLTSKASASAAEIVAQALQDYGLALVVGDERTYGKGSIQYQTVTDERASSYFKVTVGRYYTVSGRSTQIEGVKADIVVPTRYSSLNIGEKYLPYPLRNDQVSPAFLDPLIDVDVKTRSWLQKNYLPHVQKKLSFWTERIPLLRKNSQWRLGCDKDFLCFLQFLNTDPLPGENRHSPLANYGSEDLQLQEAVRILKDMRLLQKYAP